MCNGYNSIYPSLTSSSCCVQGSTQPTVFHRKTHRNTQLQTHTLSCPALLSNQFVTVLSETYFNVPVLFLLPLLFNTILHYPLILPSSHHTLPLSSHPSLHPLRYWQTGFLLMLTSRFHTLLDSWFDRKQQHRLLLQQSCTCIIKHPCYVLWSSLDLELTNIWKGIKMSLLLLSMCVCVRAWGCVCRR